MPYPVVPTTTPRGLSAETDPDHIADVDKVGLRCPSRQLGIQNNCILTSIFTVKFHVARSGCRRPKGQQALLAPGTPAPGPASAAVHAGGSAVPKASSCASAGPREMSCCFGVGPSGPQRRLRRPRAAGPARKKGLIGEWGDEVTRMDVQPCHTYALLQLSRASTIMLSKVYAINHSYNNS